MTNIVAATLQRVTSVATLPSIALEIMRIADDPASTTDTLYDLLSTDPALAARVLKVVNSAFYGRPRQVASTHAAIQLLGVSAIRNIALAASMTRIFRTGQSVAGFDVPSLWVHAVCVGAAARRIADVGRAAPPDEALLAGLLHDIGLLVSMQAWLPEFSAVLAATREDPSLDFRQVERSIIGADHEQFGEALCSAWHFPRALGLVAGHHHEPERLPEGDRILPAIVHVADIISARADIGFTRTVNSNAINPALLELIGVTPAELDTIQQSLVGELTQAMMLFAG